MGHIGHPSAAVKTSERPLVSVVIAAFSRPEKLRACLKALCAQTLPASQFEVVVCDDGSPVPLEPLVMGFADRLQVRAVRQDNAGPASARNFAAAHASAAHLAFTDDDCLPAPDWLARLAVHIATNSGHLVGGALRNALTGDPFATASQLVGDAVTEYWERHNVPQRLFTTSNMLVPRAAFERLEGFSTSFPSAAGEDYDFCARWHHAGLPSLYAPEAVVLHGHGHTFGSFCRQHFNYGRALLRVRQRVANRSGARVRFGAPSFYANLLTYPLRQGYGAQGIAYAALVLLSQAATLSGGAREALLRGRWGLEGPAR